MSIRRWLFTTNHKDIGILYLVTALLFGLIGGVFALLIRTQLALVGLGRNLIDPSTYNQLVTMHGVIMVLFFLSPLAFGFANYIVPLQIGARDMAFPRLNALSYWLYLFGGLVAASSFLLGGAADVGWTFYAPFSSTQFSPGVGVPLAVAGLLMLIASVMVSTINFLTTILHLRAPGMTLLRMPLFTWSILLTVLMMLFAFPSVAAAALELLADRILGTSYFSSEVGGSILWDHLFWFFAHPEVYIVLFPALGAVAEIIPVFTRRPIYGKNIIIVSLFAAAVLSHFVWVHHMFITGIHPGLRKFMTITTESISIPFGLIFLAFIASLWGGSIRFKTPMLFALGEISLFIIGGVSGVFNSSVALDYRLRGTYWIVAHFHYALVGGAVFGVLAAVYYWFPKMSGRMYNEALGKLHFWLTFVGFNVTFFPQFFLTDMPRRIYTYAAETGWAGFNLISTAGAIIVGLGQIFFVLNLVYSLLRGGNAEADPWGGSSFEWSVSSPPPSHNFDIPPILITASDPQPGNPKEVSK